MILNRSPLQMTIFGSAGCWLVDGLLMACFAWFSVERKIPQGNHVGFPRLEWSAGRSN